MRQSFNQFKKHPVNVSIVSRPLKLFFFALVSWFMSGCQKDFKKLSDSESVVSDHQLSLSGSSRPNILLILVDDVGYEVPTIDGGMSYSTPNIDNMALSGVRFTQAHSSPSCSPSRVAILTGKYNNRNYTQWGHMETNQLTFANMLRDSGYATCYTGKWQLDGGDNAIHTFGWDKYSVWLPFDVEEYTIGSRYKNSQIYEGGDYLPASATENVYTDDYFTNYLLNFIDSSKKKQTPFLAMYSVMLIHPPISPTPLDPEYTTWDYVPRNGDKAFFASSAKYMDMKVGQILKHLDSIGIQNNTLVIFTADNGTSANIKSLFNGFYVKGGKKSTDEPGTNVPLIAYWPGKVQSGVVSDRLIDFTDFLPTFAEVAGVPRPNNYGILDGISFWGDMTGAGPINQRTWIYDANNTDPINPKKKWVRWVQNDSYKLYDTGKFLSSGLFLKIEKGKPDGPAIPDSLLTPDEKVIKRKFSKVLTKNR